MNRILLSLGVLLVALTSAGAAYFVLAGMTVRPITGTVIDAIDTPVAGARVSIKNPSGGKNQAPIAATTTDSRGHFSLPAKKSGNFIVEAEAKGVDHSVPVTIAGAKSPGPIALSLPFFAKDYRKIPPVDPEKDLVSGEGEPDYVRDVLEIIWKKGASKGARDALLAKIEGAKVRGEISEINLTEISVAPGTLEKAKAEVLADPSVEAAAKAYVAAPQFVPADPDYADPAKNWSLQKVEAEEAWEITKGQRTMIVAVIDAGFQPHPDLGGAYMPSLQQNYSADPMTQDPVHGNHVSGIIAMQNNRVGSVGSAFRVKIMPMKVVTWTHIADAIRLASTTNRVRVINLSMGIGWDDIYRDIAAQGGNPITPDAMREIADQADVIANPAAAFAKANDRIVVHSAGNDNMTADLNGLNSQDVVTVANSNWADGRGYVSNWGDLITIAAPGEYIWSASADSQWASLSGTSMASPLAAGVIALMKSANPALTVDQTIAALKDAGQTANATGIGKRINAWQSVLAVTDQWGIKGQVVSGPLRTPVAGVTVYPAGRRDLAVKTDTHGDFTIAAIPRDIWQLKVEKRKRKLEVDIPRLPDKEYVVRDEVIQLGQTEHDELRLTLNMRMVLKKTDRLNGLAPRAGRFGTRIEFSGPLKMNKGKFTVALEGDRYKPKSGFHTVTAVNGKIKSDKPSGLIVLKVMMDGTANPQPAGFDFRMKQPIYVAGRLQKKETIPIDEETLPWRWQFKVTAVKTKPFSHPMAYGEGTRLYSYTFDPAIDPLAINGGKFEIEAIYEGYNDRAPEN